MKICIIGPGGTSIPPVGWGAVESIVWDLYTTLTKFNHEVLIVNTPDKSQIINQVNSFNPDFVHIHYDDHFDIEQYIDCDNIAITSHYGYINYPDKYDPGYWRMLHGFCGLKRAKIFALSNSIAKQYTDYGFPKERIYVIPNGVRDDLFYFSEFPIRADKSVYLGKIEDRKKQYLYSGLSSIEFVGEIVDYRFDKSLSNYLGPLSRENLYKSLTYWPNLVLLSDGEAHPLVCLEAMVCGLGLVISEASAANLDRSKVFIDIIPNDKLSDLEYVSNVIKSNRDISTLSRHSIRDYCIENFSWDNIVKNKYLPSI